MSRHTHDELEDALELRILIDDDDMLYIYPPILITFVLYRAIRNGGVDTKHVLPALCSEPKYLPRFLTLCGDDDIEVVLKCAESSMQGACTDVMKAWAARQSVRKMLRRCGLPTGE